MSGRSRRARADPESGRFPRRVRRVGADGSLVEEPPGRVVVFHHIPKTAGSSFRRILDSLFQPEEVCAAEIDDEVLELAPAERAAYRLFAGHFSYEMVRSRFPDAVWLTLLRHPVDRVVSNYHNLRDPRRHTARWRERVRTRPEAARFLEAVREMSLEEFVHWEDPAARNRVVNRQTLSLLSLADEPMAARPGEAAMLPSWDAELLAQARRNLEQRFAFVGVQEDFEDSLQLFALSFGLRPFQELEPYTTNRNPEKDAGARYAIPTTTRRALEEANAMDLVLWEDARRLVRKRLLVFQERLLEVDAWLRSAPRARGSRSVRLPRRVAVTVDRLLGRRGFHALERDAAGRCFCWTGCERRALAELRFEVADAQPLRVTVHALAAGSPRVAAETRIRFDDRPLEDVECRRLGSRLRLTGRVRAASPAWPRRHHTVCISAPSELEPGTAEHRRPIGLAVHRVEVEAL